MALDITKLILNKFVIIGAVILAIWFWGGMDFITRNPALVFFGLIGLVVVWGLRK